MLGVCGSIACYKAADLASKLVQAGAIVDVVLTESAQEFVTPFTFRSLTGRLPYTSMFEPVTNAGEEHVALSRRADIVIVAPATATTLARLAHGLADDMLSLTVLATKAPVLRGAGDGLADVGSRGDAGERRDAEAPRRQFVGPESGRLASGNVGAGRLSEPLTIVGAAKLVLAQQRRPRRPAHRRQRRWHAGADRPRAGDHEPIQRQDGLRAGGGRP